MSRSRRTLEPVRVSWGLPAWLSAATVVTAVAVLVGTFVLTAPERPAMNEVSLEDVTAAAEQAQDADVDAVADGNEAEAAASPPEAAYELFLARDPFDPVVPEEEPDAPEFDENGDPAPTPSDPDDPSAPSQPGTPGTAPGIQRPDGDLPCRGDVEVVCDGRVLTLEGVSTDAAGLPLAAIRIDDDLYRVAVGESFGDGFELRDIGERNVTLRYRDQVFVLRLDEVTLK